MVLLFNIIIMHLTDGTAAKNLSTNPAALEWYSTMRQLVPLAPARRRARHAHYSRTSPKETHMPLFRRMLRVPCPTNAI